jgi:predicted dehydrogenase
LTSVEEEMSVKIVIVGLGRMGLAHAAILKHVPQAEVVALVDGDASLGKMTSSMGLRLPFYRSTDEAVQNEELDAAFVCTPTHAHLPVTQTLIEAKIDVFVEKPLGHSVVASRQLAEWANCQDIVHGVGYTLEHNRVFRMAKALLQDGAIGSIQGYRATVFHSEVLRSRRGWLFDPARSGGGVLMNIVSHMVYFVCDCFGLPETVSASTKSVYSPWVEDEALVSLAHHSGIAGEIQASWSVPGKPILELELSVRGELGGVTVNRRQLDMHLHKAWRTYSAGTHRIHASSIPSSALYDFSPEYDGEAYYAEDLDFIKCCVSRVPYTVSFDTALRVEETVAAMYESSRSRTEIELPGGERL